MQKNTFFPQNFTKLYVCLRIEKFCCQLLTYIYQMDYALILHSGMPIKLINIEIHWVAFSGVKTVVFSFTSRFKRKTFLLRSLPCHEFQISFIIFSFYASLSTKLPPILKFMYIFIPW